MINFTSFHLVLQYHLHISRYSIMNAELSGTAAKKAFIPNRLQKKEQFFESMKNLN